MNNYFQQLNESLPIATPNILSTPNLSAMLSNISNVLNIKQPIQSIQPIIKQGNN
jgi:hypothetical protein